MWMLVLILIALNCTQFCRYRRLAIEIRKLSAAIIALVARESSTVFFNSRPNFTASDDLTVKIVPWSAETDKRKLH